MWYCEHPECKYTTLDRKCIHNHHIISKKKGGKSTIFLCPTHHTKIYIPGEIKGIHSIKGTDSIILIGWKQSTAGRILEYRTLESKEPLYYMRDQHEETNWVC